MASEKEYSNQRSKYKGLKIVLLALFMVLFIIFFLDDFLSILKSIF